MAETQASFETFFQDTHQRLYGGLCLVIGNRHEAEDVMQDAYLKLWERWERVSLMEDPAGFLFRTAMNVFRSRYRRTVLVLRRSVSLAPSVDDLAAVEDREELSLMVLREGLDETFAYLALRNGAGDDTCRVIRIIHSEVDYSAAVIPDSGERAERIKQMLERVVDPSLGPGRLRHGSSAGYVDDGGPRRG